MRKGLTPSINNIIDAVSTLDAIKSYVLCGGTSLAIQLGHRHEDGSLTRTGRAIQVTRQYVLSAHGLEGLAKDLFDYLREMLHFKDVLLGGDVFGSVFRGDRGAKLGDYLTTVNACAYPVDGHTCFGLPRRFDGFVNMTAIHSHPAKLWKEGRMEVEHPMIIFIDQESRNDE